MFIVERGARQEYVEKETGQRFWSVSQIRRMAYDSYAQAPMEQLEAARYRGQLVHRFLWKFLAHRTGLFAVPHVDPRIDGYCRSVMNWAVEHDVTAVMLEQTGVNRKEGYAGTIDGQVLYGPKHLLTLMDGKSGEKTVTDLMQLVLYDALEGFESKQLVSVYFQADGSDAKEVVASRSDRITEWAWAMSALGVLRGRLNHGV